MYCVQPEGIGKSESKMLSVFVKLWYYLRGPCREVETIFYKIIYYVKFILIKVLSSMFFSYIIPVINIVMIVLLNDTAEGNIIVVMNGINILIANNACYIASIASYYKINEKFNVVSGHVKTLGLVISAVTFAISTYELQRNLFYIPVIIYEISAIFTSLLCIVLTIFAQLEDVEINKRIEKSQLEKAKEIISKSEEKESYDLDGDNFQV